MEINAQAVIDKLTAKLAKLEGQNAVLEVQVDELTRVLNDAPAADEKGDPIAN